MGLVPRSSLAVSAAVLALVALTTIGCPESPPASDSWELPLEEVFSAENILVIPDRRWEAHADEGVRRHAPLWRFQGSTAFHVYVQARPSAPLVFELSPAGLTHAYRITADWDGRPLWRHSLRVRKRGLEVRIDPDDLTPGQHVLELQRAYAEERQRPEGWSHHNVFSTVSWRSGVLSGVMEPGFLERQRSLRDFLSFGVAGLTQQKHSGWMFVGPAETSVDVNLADPPGVLSVVAENDSDSPAVFTVKVDGTAERVTLGSMAREPLEVRLPVGRSRLEFAVEGSSDGRFLWGSPWISRSRGGERTPLVLITLDTTRRDAVWPYSGRAEVTPHLEALAAEATVFDLAHSTAPWTLPSHVSMFTGKHPSRHGAGVWSDRVAADELTVARLLRDAGYLTAGFAGGGLCSYRFGVGRFFNRYRDPDTYETRGERLTGYVESLLGAFASEPLFLFVNYFDPHEPYQAPEAFAARLNLPTLAESVEGQPVWSALARGEGDAWYKVGTNSVKPTPEGLAYLRAAYLAEVAYVDDQIGRLFALLKRHDLYDRALIVVVSDHGELLGEDNHFGHSGRLDPELVHVPLIVKWPHQREGRRVGELVSGVDIFATLLDAAGIQARPSDGICLTDECLSSVDRQRVFMEEHESRVHPLIPGMKISQHLYGVQETAFRQLVWGGGEECQKLTNGEWESAACSSLHQEMLPQLEKLLRGSRDGGIEDLGSLSPDVEESLRALGYLQ